jgi:hypothetical protein
LLRPSGFAKVAAMDPASDGTAVPARVAGGARAALAACALLLTALAAGCTSPSPAPSSPEPTRMEPSPSWIGRPHSWDRMRDIERWQGGGQAKRDPYLRLESELALAEGRVHLAREESERLTAPELERRLAMAKRGFEEVQDDVYSNRAQRGRARRGLESVREFEGGVEAPQATAALGEVVRRSSWGARAPRSDRLTRASQPWSRITVHHSGTEDDARGVRAGEGRDVVRKIQKFHMETRGWGDIAYHYLIDPAGRVYEGRSIRYQGAHAGYDANRKNNNPGNIGICMLGDFESSHPPRQAIASLDALIGSLRGQHGISRARVYGHRELAASECPGPDLARWVQQYRGSARVAEASAKRATRPAASSGTVR